VAKSGGATDGVSASTKAFPISVRGWPKAWICTCSAETLTENADAPSSFAKRLESASPVRPAE
jgi:hypothetical protein